MEPTYVLDTSVLVDLARADQRAIGLVAGLAAGSEIWSVTVVRTELIAGARPDDGPSIRRILDDVRWHPVDVPLADLAGRMAAHYSPMFSGIGLADYLIAAGTRLLGAQLLTLNVRHFPMFDGLQRAYEP